MTSPISDKAESQLKMNPRTASHKLNRNIVISLLAETNRDKCLRCADTLTHDSWSVEHLEEWLDSDNPINNFFRLDNIGFVCKTCNSTYNRGRFDIRRGLKELKKPVTHYQPPLLPPGYKPSLFNRLLTFLKEIWNGRT